MLDTPISRRTLLPAGTALGNDADHPPYDFTDGYYRSNGVLPGKLVGRRSGTDGLSVFDTPPDNR